MLLEERTQTGQHQQQSHGPSENHDSQKRRPRATGAQVGSSAMLGAIQRLTIFADMLGPGLTNVAFGWFGIIHINRGHGRFAETGKIPRSQFPAAFQFLGVNSCLRSWWGGLCGNKRSTAAKAGFSSMIAAIVRGTLGTKPDGGSLANITKHGIGFNL